MFPPEGRHWRTKPSEFDILELQNKIEWSKTGNPRIKKYAHEHKGKKIQDIWTFKDPHNPLYPTEKNSEMLKQIIKQSSKENSIVMDCFAGSGGTLINAMLLGRKYIGVDNSEISMDIIKKRLKENPYTFVKI
jgi:adenine-specific DNA-methyltransferase